MTKHFENIILEVHGNQIRFLWSKAIVEHNVRSGVAMFYGNDRECSGNNLLSARNDPNFIPP